MERESRTVMEETTSPRASFFLTGFRSRSLAVTPWLKIGHSGYAANALGRVSGQGVCWLKKRQNTGTGSVMKYDTNFKSVEDRVSPEEWAARIELAACYRLIDQYGMTDLI